MKNLDSIISSGPLTPDNFLSNFLLFGLRQAGVSLVYDHESGRYYYNAYCLEQGLLKDLLSNEFEFLEDALAFINSEFGSWVLESYDKDDGGCGSCAAKG